MHSCPCVQKGEPRITMSLFFPPLATRAAIAARSSALAVLLIAATGCNNTRDAATAAANTNSNVAATAGTNATTNSGTTAPTSGAQTPAPAAKPREPVRAIYLSGYTAGTKQRWQELLSVAD